jgi:collagen type I/II/III/V/XI/XXIV/XXVII alpha
MAKGNDNDLFAIGATQKRRGRSQRIYGTKDLKRLHGDKRLMDDERDLIEGTGGGGVGETGPTGPVGPQGATGPAGAQGPAGAAGADGAQGPSGANGQAFIPDERANLDNAKVTEIEGGSASPTDYWFLLVNPGGDTRAPNTTPAGISGDMGGHLVGYDGTAWYDYGEMTGVAGPTGPAGAQGPTGAQGEVGATGPAGAAGVQGVTGVTGANGATGPIGETGVTGATGVGETGAQGPQGDIGETGATGPIGETGPAGGPTGATGPIGETGPAGPAGPAGATGPAGPAGDAGATGATGPAGADGAVGATGPAGAGVTGATGPTGPAGAAGADGATGPTGPAGADGAAGTQGVTGVTGATGPAGAGGDVAIEDDGTSVVAAASTINFTGAGVTVSDAGSNEATVNIPGGGGGGGAFTFDADLAGTTPATRNFTNVPAGWTVTDAATAGIAQLGSSTDDLVITHNLGSLPVEVSVWQVTDTGPAAVQGIARSGSSEYTGLKSTTDMNSIRLGGFEQASKALKVVISF